MLALREVATTKESLLPSVTFGVSNAVAYTNISSANPEHGRHVEHDIYTSRNCVLSSVDLVALPAGATVIGGGHFILCIGTSVVSEQFPSYFSLSDSNFLDTLNQSRPIEWIASESLLVARYGIFTWGHWLGEILPKLVLVERRYPERFSFILPDSVLIDSAPDLPWIRLRESIAAYGIAESRILSLSSDRDYSFSSLFAVTPIWSDHLMHPGAMECMRTQLELPIEPAECPRLAIDRIPRYGRELANYGEIKDILTANGFTFLATGSKSFREQVAVFNGANLIFSVLGSDLTNIMYAPGGVKVITVAPATFGDRFFYGLILGREGRQIDLRGPITEMAPDLAHKSKFSMDANEVLKAISIFDAVR